MEEDHTELGFPVELPMFVGARTPVNVYIYDREGNCLSEMQDPIEHDTIVGMNVSELSWVGQDYVMRFEQSLTGAGSAWVNTVGEVLKQECFVRSHLVPGFPPGFVIGFSMPMSRKAQNFLQEEALKFSQD